MREGELKARLKQIKAGEGPVCADRFGFAMEHMEALGSPDSELRDELFYEVLDSWIADGSLGGAQLGLILDLLLSDAWLLAGIGEESGPGVCRRSFSVLVAASILERDNAAPFLDGPAQERARERIIEYAALERNLEGHSEEWGWAHATAHTADALRALAASAKTGPAEARAILSCVATLILKNGRVYAFQEDKRLARVLVPLLERGIPGRDEILSFLEALAAANPPGCGGMEGYARSTNLLNFLRALFFYLEGDSGELGSRLRKLVRVLMRIA